RAGALARADHGDGGHVGEDLVRLEHGADLDARRRLQAELTDVPLRLALGLGRDLDAGVAAGLAPLRLQLRRDVAALRPDRLAPLLVEEAELHGVVAVAVLAADLPHRARPQLHHPQPPDPSV